MNNAIPSRRTLAILVRLAILLIAMAIVTPVVLGDGVSADQITTGQFQTYAAGIERGFDISGHAVMIRLHRRGKTIVFTRVTGLNPDTTYPSHVHDLPCNDNNGGGHYKHDPDGPAEPPNEIWPTLDADDAGIGRGFDIAAFIARPEAQSIVVHDTDGARIACADLD